jgi:hypothetical protein
MGERFIITFGKEDIQKAQLENKYNEDKGEIHYGESNNFQQFNTNGNY